MLPCLSQHFLHPVEELKRFLGLLGQLNNWTPDLAQHCTKIRVLLKKDCTWLFMEEGVLRGE